MCVTYSLVVLALDPYQLQMEPAYFQEIYDSEAQWLYRRDKTDLEASFQLIQFASNYTLKDSK